MGCQHPIHPIIHSIPSFDNNHQLLGDTPRPQYLLFFCRERKEVKENTTLQTSLSRETQLKIAETVDFQSSCVPLVASVTLRDAER